MMAASNGRRLARWLPELAMAVALVILPFGFDAWLGSADLFTRILIWGIFGLGFDLLFGRTGLLSFGQAAFYGTGGFVTAYLLTSGTLGNVWLAMAAGIAAAAAFSVFVGFLALRRVGIYFAMITLAFGELSYFLENSPLSNWTGGENGLPGVPAPSIDLGGLHYSFAGSWPSYQLVAGFYFIGFVFARFVVLSPVGAVLTAIQQNPERTAALGHDVGAYKLAVFVLGRRVRRLRRRAARHFPELYAAGRLRAGHLGPARHPDRDRRRRHADRADRRRRDLAVAARRAAAGARRRRSVEIHSRLRLCRSGHLSAQRHRRHDHALAAAAVRRASPSLRARQARPATRRRASACWRRCGEALHRRARKRRISRSKPATSARPMAASAPSTASRWRCREGACHAIIGPNGAGKSTFLRLLKREETVDSGNILLHGADITAADVTAAYQYGLAKSYQINQLFPHLTVRQNLRIGALGRQRGRLRLDVFRSAEGFAKVEAIVAGAARRARTSPPAPTSSSTRCPMARSAGSSSAWRWRRGPRYCCSTSRSPA